MISPKYILEKNFPPNLYKIFKITPEELPITALARMMCQNCGLWNRAILCPPLLYQTYPQYKTIESSIEYFKTFDDIYVYVFRNDGSKRFWYKKEQEKYNHFRLRTVTSGRQLKGIEAVGSKYLTVLMHKIRTVNRKLGYRVETYLPGHCDLCPASGRSGGNKCPNRNNPPCKMKGLPSLESTGINVYSLLESLNVEYEFPVMSYLTTVTMMAIGKKK